MKMRLITSFVGIALILLLMIFSSTYPIMMTLVLSIISAMCFYEVLSAKKIEKNPESIIGYLFSILTPLLITTQYFYITAPIYVYLMFIAMILQYKKIKLDDVVFSVLMNIIMTYSFSSMIKLYSSDYKNLAFYIVFILGIPWMADTGAFFAGKFFGKKKLCPEISPKKTVEGAIGGFLTSFLGVTLFIVIFKFLIFPVYNPTAKINYVALYLYTLIGTPLSIFGDLIFSVIKRNNGIKDYGSLIPGHGGLLDRLDSVLFSAPILFLINQILPILT